MGLKRCRLKDRDQRRLLEFFVLEVTARAAADLMGIQVNTAALFYRKIRIEFDSNAYFGFDELTGWTYFNLNAIYEKFPDAENTVVEADVYHSN